MAEQGEPLSERELDVLHAVARGASTREIGQDLSISPNTVKVHLRRIYAKLGVSSRTEAMRAALAQGLVTLPDMPLSSPAPTTDESKNEDVAEASSETFPLIIHNDNQAADTPSETARLPVRQAADRAVPWRWGLAVVVLAAVLLAGRWLLRGSAPTQSPTPTPAPAQEIGQSRWFAVAAMPQPAAHMAVASLGLDLYQIGGQTAVGVVNTARLYDTRAGQWRLLSAKPTAVADAAAAVLGGEVYVAGGRLADGQPAAVVEAYSPTNNAWRPVASLPRPSMGGLLLSDGGLLYFLGGEDDGETLADSYVYDPGSDRWRVLPALRQARAFAAGGVVRGILYVVGGMAEGEPLASCETFDPIAESWSACADMAQPRAGAGAAVLVNKLYVLGGASGPVTGALYDPKTATWESVDIPQAITAWRYFGMAAIESRIYVFGGEQEGEVYAGMVYFAPLENKIYLPAAPGGG